MTSEYHSRIVYMGMGIIANPKTQAEYDSLMRYKRIMDWILAGFLVVALVVIIVAAVVLSL